MFKENNPIENESCIWHNFRNGSEKDFELIYDSYFSQLYKYGLHISLNKDLVKDCIQNLFFELWKNKDNLAEVLHVKAYLFTCIRRKIVEELRKENKFPVNAIADDYHFKVDNSHEFSLILDQQNDGIKKILSKSISNLTKRQKEAIFLKFYENMEYLEIASIMSLKTAKYARTLIYRAIDVLKSSISKEAIY